MHRLINVVCCTYMYKCIQVHLRLDFTMEATTTNPDQTWEQSDLSLNCLQDYLRTLADKRRQQVGKFVCLFFYLILYNFQQFFMQLCPDGSSWVEPVLSNDKCVLLKDTTHRRQ